MSSKPLYIVAQTGARRGYAVPVILEQAGMLECFHTDVCGNIGLLRPFSRLISNLKLSEKIKLLASRKVPFSIIDKTRTYLWTSLRWSISNFLSKTTPEADFRLHMQRMLHTGNVIARHAFGKASHLYIMNDEFPSLVIAAKKAGLKVVSEVYILRSSNAFLKEERTKFPDWEETTPEWDAISNEMTGGDFMSSSVDYFICPSVAVRQDLVTNWDIKQANTAIVPYGVSSEWLKLVPRPQEGRLLFVGTADLRKGIHYLAFAAEELRRRGRNYEFRVAGNVTDRIRNHPRCRNLNFLGRVSREQIREEFCLADLFVLPTLAEGSAEVTYEALACGLPLVTTTSAGSVAENEIDALIVSERDIIALADAIERLVEDRDLRTSFSSAARLKATEYTWEKYGERLIDVLVNLR